MATFNIDRFLKAAGGSRQIAEFSRSSIIFSQGDASTSIMYLQSGHVKISVVSPRGKEAALAILGPGDFFGEGSLLGRRTRDHTATAMTSAAVLSIQKTTMQRLLRQQPDVAAQFINHMLMRNARVEDALVDQLFNSSERRLARALLLLARCDSRATTWRVQPKPSQEMLAEMIGTTRSRVSFFMNKFRTQGHIEYDGGLKVNRSLLTAVLRKPGGGSLPRLHARQDAAHLTQQQRASQGLDEDGRGARSEDLLARMVIIES
jgi:CRP/FNR family cyclic AMP-dependent transcriptional regulator